MKHTSTNANTTNITWKYNKTEYMLESYFLNDSIRLPNQFNLKVRKCYVQALYKKRTSWNFILGDWILIEKTQIEDPNTTELIQTSTYEKAISKYGLQNTI